MRKLASARVSYRHDFLISFTILTLASCRMGEPIVKMFTKLFNRCIADDKVPSSWKNASVIILHKNRDTPDIKNYRPISLLPVTYKVFSRILLRRILSTSEQRQPRKEAGFRAGLSFTDHIQVVNQLQEKAN